MRGRALTFRDFTGGLNTKAGPGGLEENEAADLLNVRPLVRGSLQGRAGDVNTVTAAALGSSTVMSLNTVGALASGETEGLLIGTIDGKLWPLTGSLGSSLGTFTAFAIWDFIDAPVSGGQGPMYGVNGTDAKYVTAAPAIGNWTAATGTLPSTAKYLAYVGNRVWAAGMSSYGAIADPGSALVFSNLGDPRDWPAANVVQFDPNDGEEITAIGEVAAGLLVFKRSKAWLVYDLDTGANRPLGVGVGCISHRSIQVSPQGTIFLGERNVWVTDGTTTRSLSDNVEPTLLTALVAGYLPSATSTMDGQRYLLAYGTTVLEYDLELRSWWKHAFRGSVLASARLSGETDGIYAGGSSGVDHVLSSGHLVAGTFTTLPRHWTGPLHTFGPGRDRLRGIEVDGLGWLGLATQSDFGGGVGREIRAEENLGSTPTVHSESDFDVFRGVQISFYAYGTVSPVDTTPISGYVPSEMRVDGYTLYVTHRAG